MSSTPPCRIFVVLARDAPVGVILRRGPSKWFQIIKWDTRLDTFEDGAWFHGRIYEDVCDVSPDGKLFVYFAAKQERSRYNDEYGYAWTAISRPPWLHALALWPSPCGTYAGGGRFSGNSEFNLLSPFPADSHSQHPPPRQLTVHQKEWTNFQRSPTIEVEGTNWSGRDHAGHIIYAHEGKLYRRIDSQDALLIDLNDRKPDPQAAPVWARCWPE